MDIQLKRGLLEICVLKALEKQDSYGYQIRKIFGRLWRWYATCW